MKKFSAIVLAIALVLMAAVPFCASAEDTAPITLSLEEIDTPEDGATFNLVINYATDKDAGSLKVRITYDTEKLVAQLPESKKDLGNLIKIDSPDANPSYQINTDKVGEIVLAVACEGALEKEGTIMELPVKLAEGATLEDAKITVAVEELKDTGKGTVNYVDGLNIAPELVAKFNAPETEPTADETEAPTQAPTEAPTQAPTAAPTKAPTATGEATPWALLATVAVAGAALVVLSTKKSK